MSIHGFIDSVAIGFGSLFIPKYFRDSIESQPFIEHLEAVDLVIPNGEEEGDYEVTANTLVGELNAAFRLAQGVNRKDPAIIYHHGAVETPFDHGFNKIFPYRKQEIEASLLLIRAPFHRSMKEFARGMKDLSNFVAMMAVSTALIEQLVKKLKGRGCRRVLVAGTSLGGFITNLHKIYFDSADVYTPLLAGLAVDDVFLNSVYGKGVAQKAKKNPAGIQSVLNFSHDFTQMEKNNVFPLLGRHDRIIRYEIQKDSYEGCPVKTISKGHTTGALAYTQMRQHVLDHIL